jgi:hypothetical protein
MEPQRRRPSFLLSCDRAHFTAAIYRSKTLRQYWRTRSAIGVRARNGPDDGAIAPWAVIASLHFAPEIVLSAMRSIDETYPDTVSEYGFKCSFNPTFVSVGKRGHSKG